MELNDSKENLFLLQVEMPFMQADEMNDSSEHLFLSQINESVLNNEAFLNASFDLGLETFFNECVKSDNVQEPRAKSDAIEAKDTGQENERFGRPVTDEDIEQLKESTRNKNTEKNTKWAIRIFDEWRKQRSDSLIPEATRFVMEVRKKSGEEYPSKSLYLVLCGILRHLREKNVHDKNFLDSKDPDFAELVAVIDSKMKTLLSKGHGANIKQADPISSDQEDTLWDMGVFGSANAHSLQHTVFYYSCKVFGLRGRDQLRNLNCEQFEIGEDRNGKYIRFIGRDTKTFKGGLGHMSLSVKDIKHYCTEGPRCLATYFQEYLDLLGNAGVFYRRPMTGATLKYSKQPVGVNKLSNFMKHICEKGGLKGNFTNHSGKRTCATSLYNLGIDEQDIMDKTGHRSTAAVRQYKRCSDDMHKTVSSVLDPKQPKRPKEIKDEVPLISQVTRMPDASKNSEINGTESVRDQLRQMVENRGKDLTVKNVVEDLLRKNEFILSQNNAQNLKPHTRTIKPKPTETETHNLGTVLQPKDPTVACTKEDVSNINGAIVESSVTDADSSTETDLVCAVASKIMLMTPQGQPLQMDLTCYWCNFCSFKSDKKEGLLLHVMEHRFHCKYCKFQSFSRASVIQHGVVEHKNFMDTASTLKFCIYLPDILQRNELKKRKAENNGTSSNTKKRKIDDDEDFEESLNMEVEEVDETGDTGPSTGTVLTPSKSVTPRKSLPVPLKRVDIVKVVAKTPKVEVQKGTEEETLLMPVITNVVSGQEAIAAAAGISSPLKPATRTKAPQTPKASPAPPSAPPTPAAAPPIPAAAPPSSSSSSSGGGEGTASSGVCWNCGYCGFVTLSQAFLKIHLNANHQGSSHKYVAMLVSSDVEMEKIKASDLQLSQNPGQKDMTSQVQKVNVTIPSTSSASVVSPAPSNASSSHSSQPPGIEIDNAERDSGKSEDETEEEKKIPVTFKCAHCNYSAPRSDKVKGHLFQRHSGSVMYALDMKAVKLRQKRYVFFCLKSKCNYESKNVSDFLEHCEGCTPWTEGSENVDSAMIKSLEMTKQFIVKTQSTVSGQSKEFRFDRITAEYGCDYCSYISNNNTRLKKHVLSIHANKSCVIRDLQAEKNKRQPTVYFCSHCLWETRDSPELVSHLKENHGTDSMVVPPTAPAASTSAAPPNTTETASVSPSVSTTKAKSGKTSVSPKAAASKGKTRASSSEPSSAEASPSDKGSEKDEEDDEIDLTDLYAGIVSKTHIAKAMREYVENEQSATRGRGRPSRNAAVQARMKTKMTTKQPALYRCEHCSIVAFGTKMIRQHLKAKHKDQALYATDVLKHAKKPADSHKVFFCPDDLCVFSATLHVDVEQHAKNTHGLKDDNPDLILMSRVPVRVSHLLKAPEGGHISTTGETYECLYCSETQVFYTRTEMKKHLTSTHPKEPLIFRDCIARKLKQHCRFYICSAETCEYTSEKEENCSLHALAHKKTKIRECSKCQWFTTTASEMKAHQKEAHAGELAMTVLVDLDLDSQGQLVKLVNGTAIKTEQK